MGYLIIRSSHSPAKSSPILYQFVLPFNVTAKLFNHILTKSSQEVSQFDVSDQDLIYYTGEMYLFKYNKPNEISFRSVRN